LSGGVFAALLALVGGIPDSAMPAILIPFIGLGVAGGVFGTIRFEANTRRPQLESLLARLQEAGEEAVRKLPSGP